MLLNFGRKVKDGHTVVGYDRRGAIVMTRRSRIESLALLPLALSACQAQAPLGSADVTLSPRRAVGPARPLLMGQNFVDNIPRHHAWDPAAGDWLPDVKAALAEESPTVMRFPGGLYANQFHWAQTIGPLAQRPLMGWRDLPKPVPATVGADEFMSLIAPLPNCKALITVNISRCAKEGPGTAQEAAAWVAYYNGAADNPTAIGVDELGTDWRTVGYWAKQRAANGHSAPYGVPYWELGNEVNQGDHATDDFLLTAEEYVQRGREYLALMKKVDPTIKVGIVGWSDVLEEKSRAHGGDVACGKGGGPWLATVLPAFRGQADFFVFHHYNSVQPDISRDRRVYWQAVLGFAEAIMAPRLDRLVKVLAEHADSLPIWVTEYNYIVDWHQGEAAVRDQYRLASGLAVADALMVMARQPTVASAEFFEFIGGMGTVYAGDGKTVIGIHTEPGKVLRHPSHWVFQMFRESFGQPGATILAPDVRCDSYAVMGYTVPRLGAAAVSLDGGRRIDVLLLNRNLDNPIDCTLAGPELAGRITAAEAVELNSWDPASRAPLADDNAAGQKVFAKPVAPPRVEGGVVRGRLAPHSLTRWRLTLTAPAATGDRP